MNNEVLVVGSVAFDTIENANGHAQQVLGGAASYSSICASYFAKPSIVAVVGTDFTSQYRKPFERRKVDLSGLQVKEGKTFHWGGQYDKDFNTAVTKFTELKRISKFWTALNGKTKKRFCRVFGQYWPGTAAFRFKASQKAPPGSVRHDELLDFFQKKGIVKSS